jgi:hypothetical protein
VELFAHLDVDFITELALEDPKAQDVLVIINVGGMAWSRPVPHDHLDHFETFQDILVQVIVHRDQWFLERVLIW